MSAVIGTTILLGGFFVIFLIIRVAEKHANPLVKFGMTIGRAPAIVAFRGLAFAKFSIRADVFAHYRGSMDYAIHDRDIFLRTTFLGIPIRCFRIPNNLISSYVDRERGFRIKSDLFEFYATFGDDDDLVRKGIK
jgi:hypothetical protein